MKTHLMGLLALAAFNAHAPTADACGVKLTVKSSAPRKAVAHTSNPSTVLLLGSPPARLEHDLSAAGHKVDVAPNANAAKAKNKDYQVVVTDSDHEAEARQNFGDSQIIVRSGDVGSDVRSVEGLVARRPTNASSTGTVLVAKTERKPIAAGPPRENTSRIVDAKPPTDTVAVAPPAPPPPRPEPVVTPPPRPEPAPPPTPPADEHVATTVPEPTETKAPKQQPKVEAIKPDTNLGEVYFSLGKAEVGSTGQLTRIAKKLAAHADVSVVVEGHADPTGTPEGNMELSRQRAEWAKEVLVNAGVDASRIEVAPFGDTKLKYGRSDGRNRRVAVVAK